MAQQTIGVGTEADDNTGDTIRDAFVKVNANFTELYTDDAGDVNSVTAGTGLTGTATTGALTINAIGGDGITANADELEVSVDGSTIELSATDGSGAVRIKDAGVTLAKIQNVAANSLLVRDANSSGVLTEKAVTDTQILIGDGTGFTAAALSGDVTMANTGAVTIANDAVEHAMLEPRYTAKATSTGTGSQNLDASTATTFLLTGNVATATLTIQNMKLGQVIDIVLSGTLSSAAITLATNFTSATINKVGSTDLDTSATNVIQVVCIDDTDSAAIVNYSINTFAADTTP
jgi:hypothetical protein